MSVIETVQAIVETEREAAKILEDAQTRASQIHVRLNSLIEEQRNAILESAKGEAATIVERAENDGKTEAERFEKESEESVGQLIDRASARKSAAIQRLVSTILGG